MKKSLLLSLVFIISFTSCNLYGGLSSPSNDRQKLDAARAAFDAGNYPRALELYQSLSGSSNDIKINESALATLAQLNVFSMSDLVTALGTGTGNGTTLTTMANYLVARGITTAATRVSIQAVYASAAGIKDSKLQAFTQFISAISMLNEMLAATATGSTLKVSDIVLANACTRTSAGCAADANCAQGAGTALADYTGVAVSLNTASDWTGAIRVDHILEAFSKASTAASALGTSGFNGSFTNNSGSSNPILTAASNKCARSALITFLGF